MELERREAALAALKAFEDQPWARKYRTIVQSRRRARKHVIPFFEIPPDMSRVIYKANSIESLLMQIRKISKSRGHFAIDDAAINQFAVMYCERFTGATA
jgi:putative transposase